MGALGYEGVLTLLLKTHSNRTLFKRLKEPQPLSMAVLFANIAHGCNSLIATKMAAKLADYVVTEAGFGADLGAEKFLHIKTRAGEFKPSAVVIVATVRALKMHGGMKKTELKEENAHAVLEGIHNLEKHIETVQAFGLPYIVAVNRFMTDTKEEIQAIEDWCGKHGHPVKAVNVWEEGGEGGTALAEELAALIEKKRTTLPICMKRMIPSKKSYLKWPKWFTGQMGSRLQLKQESSWLPLKKTAGLIYRFVWQHNILFRMIQL